MFAKPPMGASALQDTMRMVAIANPFPKRVGIPVDYSGRGSIKDWTFLDVPELTRDMNVGEGTVKYTYTFEDEGGDHAVDDNRTRTLQVLSQCQLTEFLDLEGMYLNYPL